MTDIDPQGVAWRSARTVALLAVLGNALTGAAISPFVPEVLWFWGTSTFVCAVCLLAILARKSWPVAWSWAFSLVCITASTAAELPTDWVVADRGLNIGSFDVFKLVALGVATVVPFGPRLCHAIIVVCAVAPVAWYYAMPDALHAALPIEEPWNTVMFAIIAAGILAHRLRGIRIEREMAHADSEKAAMERFAKVLLAYRDMSNSPLQSIELTKELIRDQLPDAEHLTQRLERSLERLRAMQTMLASSPTPVHWTSKEESFDPAQLIREYHDDAERLAEETLGSGPKSTQS